MRWVPILRLLYTLPLSSPTGTHSSKGCFVFFPVLLQEGESLFGDAHSSAAWRQGSLEISKLIPSLPPDACVSPVLKVRDNN